jgi:hypothetical protein
MKSRSPIVDKILIESNWREGRRIDTSSFKELLEKEGYDWFSCVENFLGEFGNLKLVFLSSNGKNDSLHFDIMKTAHDSDIQWITEDYSKRIGSRKFCIIGQAFSDHMTLFMDDQGRVYGGFDDHLCFIGNNGIEAIEHICLNHKLKEL